MSHYLVLTLPEGKEGVRREHVELLSPDETLDDAIERWVVTKLGARKRNRAVAATRLKVAILHARIARPTSWHRENLTGAFTPPGERPKRRRRRS